jgi:hypothetical protein
VPAAQRRQRRLGTVPLICPYNAQVDYLYAAIIFVFIVTVLVVLWKREHPRKN